MSNSSYNDCQSQLTSLIAKPTPLANCGTRCWLNSILQTIFATAVISCPDYVNALCEYLQDQSGDINDRIFKKVFSHCLQPSDQNAQQDVLEMIEYLFDDFRRYNHLLAQFTNQFRQRRISYSVCNSCGQDTRCNSIKPDNFHYYHIVYLDQYREQIDSINYDSNEEIRRQNMHDIIVESYTLNVSSNDSQCNYCRSEELYTVDELRRSPKVIMMHFVVSSGEKHFTCPLSLTIQGDVEMKYQLVAQIIHQKYKGGGGHYYTNVVKNNQWWHISDEYFYPITNLDEHDTYMLVYQQLE